jgi:hypothetical protein
MSLISLITICLSFTKASYSTAFVSSGISFALNTKWQYFSTIQLQLSRTFSSAAICTRIDRSKAQQITSEILCPPREERDRNNAGMQAFDTASDQYRGNVIENNDPRTQYTYGEFPFDSFDLLVDKALELMKQRRTGEGLGTNHHGNKQVMVDLGSGCGRLVFYAALTRNSEGSREEKQLSDEESATWDFHGVEIGSKLHSLAVNSLERGLDNGWFTNAYCEDDSRSKIVFHNGNALLVEDPYFPSATEDVESNNNNAATNKSIQSLLSHTTLLFAYSTVWETDIAQPFNPDLQAMILSPKWSQTLASLCPNGCIAVTTDRALNPQDGWRLLDSMEVENPSVWGSVGYISVLEK